MLNPKHIGKRFITWNGMPVVITGLSFMPGGEMYKAINLETNEDIELSSKEVKKAITNQARIQGWFRNKVGLIKGVNVTEK
jgi:hypothetical protein